MYFSDEQIENINKKYLDVNSVHAQSIFKLADLQSGIENPKAYEYLMQGVCRRLKILTRCIHNIFRIYPIEKTELLPQEDLADLDINLHAFFVNVSGVFDNLAWVYVYEKDLFGNPQEGKINRHGVGLFKRKTQEHLAQALSDYLNSETIQNWYTEYSKNYRDALAHRIPLYVPPNALNDNEIEKYRAYEKQLQDCITARDFEKHDEVFGKQNRLGQACPYFAHSQDEGGRPVLIHAQILADFMTVEEMVDKFCEHFSSTYLPLHNESMAKNECLD